MGEEPLIASAEEDEAGDAPKAKGLLSDVADIGTALLGPARPRWR